MGEGPESTGDMDRSLREADFLRRRIYGKVKIPGGNTAHQLQNSGTVRVEKVSMPRSAGR